MRKKEDSSEPKSSLRQEWDAGFDAGFESGDENGFHRGWESAQKDALAQRRHTAFHEAGHAIAFALYGWPVDAVILNRGGGGSTLRADGSHGDPLERLVTDLAGQAAERPKLRAALLQSSDGKDAIVDALCAGAQTERAQRKLIRETFARLQPLFHEPGPVRTCLENLAKELFWCGRLAGPELALLLRPVVGLRLGALFP